MSLRARSLSGHAAGLGRLLRPWSVAALLAGAVVGAPPAAAQQQIPTKVPIAFNRFYSVAEFEAKLKALAEAYPNLCTLESIGTSSQGRPLWMLTINNPATGAVDTKPAMYIDGSIHANEIQASETVLYTAWYLLGGYDSVPRIRELVDRCTFFLLPIVNPDGRATWFEDPHTPHSARSGQAPFDDDGDGIADEDGPDDLDGDGNITMMWRRDPFGTHKRDPRDPDTMIRVPTEPRADGTREYGDWSMAGQEGYDNDGDGLVNEDPPGGYDLNRNFPSGWQPDGVQGGAGAYPLCYPETRAMARFVLAHPSIAAAQAYHNAGGMILRGPGAEGREREYPRADVGVYERIQQAGAEMLPFYRPMVIYKDLYTVHGGYVNWLAEGLGIISLTNELWTDKRITQNGQEPTPEQRGFWNDRMLFQQTKVPLKEVAHPQYGTVLVGGGSKFSSRIPPPFMLEEEAHRNFAFTMLHAWQMPLLRWESVDTREISPGVWEVTVSVANDRMIPSRTARAAERRIGLPDILALEGAPVIGAGLLRQRTDLQFEEQAAEPARLVVERGVPGNGSLAARFIVQGARGTPITLTYTAEKARDLTTTVELGSTTLPK
jgi:hypothetical protein